jgi:hypothetical protein
MTDKKIAQYGGISDTSFSTGWRNHPKEEKRLWYLFLKIGASIAAGETEFVPHDAVINRTKIAEICEKIGLTDLLDDDGYIR